MQSVKTLSSFRNGSANVGESRKVRAFNGRFTFAVPADIWAIFPASLSSVEHPTSGETAINIVVPTGLTELTVEDGGFLVEAGIAQWRVPDVVAGPGGTADFHAEFKVKANYLGVLEQRVKVKATLAAQQYLHWSPVPPGADMEPLPEFEAPETYNFEFLVYIGSWTGRGLVPEINQQVLGNIEYHLLPFYENNEETGLPELQHTQLWFK